MRQKQRVFSLFLLSPSSWRAWIEIWCVLSVGGLWVVALLMEGVDRNQRSGAVSRSQTMSPSSWRAWIEIDRPRLRTSAATGRPPHGGRG